MHTDQNSFSFYGQNLEIVLSQTTFSKLINSQNLRRRDYLSSKFHSRREKKLKFVKSLKTTGARKNHPASFHFKDNRENEKRWYNFAPKKIKYKYKWEISCGTQIKHKAMYKKLGKELRVLNKFIMWERWHGAALNKYMVNRSRKHEEKQYFSLVFKSIKINYSLSRDAVVRVWVMFWVWYECEKFIFYEDAKGFGIYIT